MSVDREARDKLAAVIASYMRAEIDNFAVDDAVFGPMTDDRAVLSARISLYFFYDEFRAHPVSVTPEGWFALRRMIAFLKSDLELSYVPDRRCWSEIAWALLSASAMILALLVAYCYSLWGLLIPAVVVGTSYFVEAFWPRVNPRPFAPFDDEAQWIQHEPLLLREYLPEYDSAAHWQPVRYGLWDRVIMIAGSIVFIALIAPFWMLDPLRDLFIKRRERQQKHTP